MGKRHKDLEVWRRSIDFVTLIYKTTGDFPEREKFGLVNQMRRAAVSIPSNIAEGASRQSSKEFIQFLYMANGSLAELDTHLIISDQLGLIDEKTFRELEQECDEIGKMISGLIKYRKTQI